MGDSKTETSSNMPFEPAIPMITGGLEDAQRIYQQGGFNVEPYQGDMVANFNQDQRNAFQASRGAAHGNLRDIDGVMGQDFGQPYQDHFRRNINESINATDRAMDPAQRRQSIQNMQANVRADVMPAINGSFAGSGMAGSSLHAQNLAKGVSAGYADVSNQMYQQGENRALQAAGMRADMAGMRNQAFQQGQQRDLQAAGMMPGLAQSKLQQTDYLQDIGNQFQGQQQNEINARILRDQQGQGMEAAGIRDYLSLVGGVGGQFGTQSGTASENMGLASTLGFGLSAAKYALPLFSDRRLKTDIKRVGETDAGLGVYTYRYKAGGAVHMGVMADEVAELMPGAVGEESGYNTVNYEAIA